jgi:hypothetical protein
MLKVLDGLYRTVVAVGVLGQVAVALCILPLLLLELLGLRAAFLRGLGL